jgi:hypothetical protein
VIFSLNIGGEPGTLGHLGVLVGELDSHRRLLFGSVAVRVDQFEDAAGSASSSDRG